MYEHPEMLLCKLFSFMIWQLYMKFITKKESSGHNTKQIGIASKANFLKTYDNGNATG